VPGDINTAQIHFARACELRFQAACLNLLNPDELSHSDPKVFDLRLLLREGGLNLRDLSEPELMQRACDHGWLFACESRNMASL